MRAKPETAADAGSREHRVLYQALPNPRATAGHPRGIARCHGRAGVKRVGGCGRLSGRDAQVLGEHLSGRLPAECLAWSALARVDHALYLTAAMTGLRQGELLGLRWRDVDWAAQKVRVVRRKFRTPKSRTSSRAVPMADRVGRELELLFQASAYQADDDLAFRSSTHRPSARTRPGQQALQASAEAGRRP